jgi:predicted RNA-binding protein YlxR (DUF448 family)
MAGKDEATERTCIVTRQVLPVAALIRFVVSPDREVVPDLRRRLPGRGVWVTATAEKVALAERKHLFARGFGEAVTVAPGLADRVGDLLHQGAVAALSLARKAGTAVSGFAKVEAALEAGTVAALIHAAGADGDSATALPGGGSRTCRLSASLPEKNWIWHSAGQMWYMLHCSSGRRAIMCWRASNTLPVILAGMAAPARL